MKSPSSAVWGTRSQGEVQRIQGARGTIVGIPHEPYVGVLARHVALDLAVLIARDDRYGSHFDACTIEPRIWCSSKGIPLILINALGFRRVRGRSCVLSFAASMMAFMHSLLHVLADTDD